MARVQHYQSRRVYDQPLVSSLSMRALERSTGKTSTWAAGKGGSACGKGLPCTTKVALSLKCLSGDRSPNQVGLGNSLQKVMMKSNEESSGSIGRPEGKDIQGLSTAMT